MSGHFKRRASPRSRAARRFPRLKPGADPRLKKAFGAIGKPQPEPFKPDVFQVEALAAITRGGDCLVTAPTGSGKTWIALEAIGRGLEKGHRSWYACPLKALSNSKFSEFVDAFGRDRVGILTGDRKENPEAQVIVGTTEILRNQLYDAMHLGRSLGTDLVVLDEAHFLGDEDRGVVWEEIMIYLPPRIPLLLLSATIGNAGQIADWLESIRGVPCIVVKEDQRPVPLASLFLHPSGTLLPLLARGKSRGRTRVAKGVRKYLGEKPRRLLAPPHRLPPFGQVMGVLRKYRLLPCIFFMKSRADCDHALRNYAQTLPQDPAPGERLQARVAQLLALSPHTAGHRQRRYLEHYAVGAHHSGQLPAWKLVLETLLGEGLLDAVFATSTVAAGVNFPARTVAFLNSDRFNGREFLPLSPTEFHQMTGRAGRRGMDKIGFALGIPGKYMDLRLIARLSGASPLPVNSQIKMNFSMVLNLLLSHGPDQVEDLLQKSFAAFVMAAAGTRDRRKTAHYRGLLVKDFRRHLSFLIDEGFAGVNGKLTADGIWASQLRIDQPLLVAHGLRRDLLPVSDPCLMAALIAMFAHDRDIPEETTAKKMPKRLKTALNGLVDGLRPFAGRMERAGFMLRSLSFTPAAIVFAWAAGRQWESICSQYQIAEGDLAILVLRTADNLRHLRALSGVFPTVAACAGEAVDLLLREPVVLDQAGPF